MIQIERKMRETIFSQYLVRFLSISLNMTWLRLGGGGIILKFCGDPFKSCSLPPNKRIIPKKVNLGLIQAATSTFVLITRKFLSPSFENGFQLISHKIMELDPINVMKLNKKVTIMDILVQNINYICKCISFVAFFMKMYPNPSLENSF